MMQGGAQQHPMFAGQFWNQRNSSNQGSDHLKAYSLLARWTTDSLPVCMLPHLHQPWLPCLQPWYPRIQQKPQSVMKHETLEFWSVDYTLNCRLQKTFPFSTLQIPAGRDGNVFERGALNRRWQKCKICHLLLLNPACNVFSPKTFLPPTYMSIPVKQTYVHHTSICAKSHLLIV